MLTNEAKRRACDLANAQRVDAYWTVAKFDDLEPSDEMTALAQLCQDISDIAEDLTKHGLRPGVKSALSDHILPKPAPDPLAEAFKEAAGVDLNPEYIEKFRKALEKQGYPIPAVAKAGA